MKLVKLFSLSILLSLFTMIALGQNPASRQTQTASQPRSSISRLSQNIQLAPQAGTAVSGSGSTGQLARWTGVDGSNSYSLGNSSIFEDKFAKVGIGTSAPTSKLTVQGMIETTLGGYKFPDGTIQTTAANGSVFHDTTLKGNGTQASPLGIAVPLGLVGVLPGSNSILFVQNNGDGGIGATAIGGNSNSNIGGEGLFAVGGNSDSSFGGEAIEAIGGNSNSSTGGTAIVAVGGNSSTGLGGAGLLINGGNGPLGKGLAAVLTGDVEITGTLNVLGNVSKGGGSFKIDHPLDPENKYLYHSFVESPDMKNIYDGNVTTDANGEAVIEMPEYFDALNRDFRYQLTVIGTFAQAIVADEIKDNRFRIKTSAAGVKVSWQVTGIRQDAYANKHRIQVEELKSERERGFYLYPEAHGQSEERSIDWARNPQRMQQLKQQRKETEQLRKQPNN
jgi:hypothetical protein